MYRPSERQMPSADLRGMASACGVWTWLLSTITVMIACAHARASESALDVYRAADAQGADISGVWWARSYAAAIEPVDAPEPPLTPQGRALYEKNRAGLKSGAVRDEARTICTPDGVPRIWENPYPFVIVQTHGQVTIIYELNHVVRMVKLDGAPADPSSDNVPPYFSGHSVGRWDGSTLEIKTVGFNERTFLDATGLPHSDELVVTERIRRIEGDRRLEVVLRVDDPKMFTRPWSVRFVYEFRPDVHLETYVCGEPHRDVSKVSGVRGFQP